MKRVIVGAALVAVSIGWLLMGTTLAQREMVSDRDQEFVKKATRASIAEVRLGEMAAERAESPQVQQFGQHMVADHTQAKQELMSLAQTQKMTLPTDMDTQHHEIAEGLALLQGANFDRAFMRYMVADHEKAVQLFSKAARQSQDADLKAFAAKILPLLQEHLHMARNLAQQQGVSQAR
jgi:putative membrane protein